MSITLLRKRPLSAVDGTGDQEVHSTQKQFLRKSARGRVTKVLREHYLRPDIPCGSLYCDECQDLYEIAATPTLLDSSGQDEMDTSVRSKKAKRGNGPVLSRQGRDPLKGDLGSRHYLLLDTNVVLHQMDLLEAADFGADIIILQTVLDEVRHRSLPLYNRLNVLIGDEARRVYVFSNEARWDTFAARQENETPNDRNDRAIRQATKWYSAHIKEALTGQSAYKKSKKAQEPRMPLSVILLTDDADNLRKAKADGLIASSVRSYVESMPTDKAQNLGDLIASAGAGDEDAEMNQSKKQKKNVYYPQYLPSATLSAGVKSGQLHQGHFNPNPYNYLEGTVPVPGFTKAVLLVGREHINRSVAGDTVVVEVFPESEWKAPADEVIDAEATLKNDDPDRSDEEGDQEELDAEERLARREEKEAAAKARSVKAEAQPTGKVVGVIRRAWRSYVCHLDRASLGPSALESLAPQNVFATPLDRKIPKIRIRTRQTPALANQKFLVSIDRWDVTSRYPEGHFVRALGTVESKEAEIESLLLEWDVPYRPFSRAILDCLPEEGESWVVPPKESGSKIWQGREDLRDLIICSIDPIGCQDIDDALHARRLPNGNIEAGVHIADVSHFVHPDNPMDAEAASRGTTVYLVDKRIDMLPPLLGTNLCSLRPFVERLAFSVFWELSEDGDIVNVRFTKSVIASKEAFSYEEAQLRMDDKSRTDKLTEGIRLLNKVAIKLKAKRMAAGALNLASPEVKIHLESPETSGPIDVEQKKLLETNSLVEEFMLLANISVAQRIYDQFPQTAVLRRHLAPPPSNFEVLKDVLQKRRGLTLDSSSSRALADSLDQCVDPELPTFNTLVRIMATRCMLSAEYFCSGSAARDTFGHYGLASPIYTHFTSPIRRYADVLAHRELSAAISNNSLNSALHSRAFVDKIMTNINKRHRSAQQAGRASVEFYVALALKAREQRLGGKVREEAYVIRAFRNGLVVFVSSLGLEGLITFKRENRYEPETYEVLVPVNPSEPEGECVKIGVFDKVTVEITVEKDKNTQRGQVKMVLVDPIDSRLL